MIAQSHPLVTTDVRRWLTLAQSRKQLPPDFGGHGASCLCVSLCSVSAPPRHHSSPQLHHARPVRSAALNSMCACSGSRLEDAQEIVFYGSGIQCTKMEDVNKNVKARLRSRPTAVSASTRFGFAPRPGSDLRTFWVGALPVVAEKEPNSEFDKPQPVPLNVTVHGVAVTRTSIYYVVECKKGQERLSVEVEAMRLGRTLLDPLRRHPGRNGE